MTTAPDVLRYSVVIPVHHEAENIGPLMLDLRAALPPGGEVLIAYDDEDDPTLPALRDIPPAEKPELVTTIRNRWGRGVLYAIRTGLEAAQAPVVFVMMADRSDDLSVFAEMLRLAEQGAAVVCASRYVRGGRQHGGPLLKGMLSRLAGVSLFACGALPVHDPTNSYKAYRRDFLHAVQIESDEGFAVSMELTVKAAAMGRTLREVPASWHDRSGGESKFRLLRWLPGYLRWYVHALQRRVVRTVTGSGQAKG
jgi:dolichol-phosphate mannosyltransferase